MKLIYIRSTMEPKNYSTIRSILKKRKEKITYEIYHEERKIINVGKRKHHDDALLPNKKQKSLKGK